MHLTRTIQSEEGARNLETIQTARVAPIPLGLRGSRMVCFFGRSRARVRDLMEPRFNVVRQGGSWLEANAVDPFLLILNSP